MISQKDVLVYTRAHSVLVCLVPSLYQGGVRFGEPTEAECALVWMRFGVSAPWWGDLNSLGRLGGEILMP